MPNAFPPNQQFRLAARPLGLPRNEDWQFHEEAVHEAEEGGIVVKVRSTSSDATFSCEGRLSFGSPLPPAWAVS